MLCREDSIWHQGINGVLERTHRAPDVKAQNVRYPFVVTLHQGAIENILLDAMSTRGLAVDRPTTVHDWQILLVEEAENGYRIKVTLRHLMNSEEPKSKETIIYAKYVIGCDGAHSWVRKKLGFTMDGEQSGK